MKRWLVVSMTCALAIGSFATSVAADSTIVVTPATSDWGTVGPGPGAGEGGAAGTADGAFVTGIGTPPLGVGSFRFRTDTTSGSGGGFLLATQRHNGMSLSDIGAIDVSSRSTSGGGLTLVAPSVQIGWDPDLTTGAAAFYGRLVGFLNAAPAADTWQRWQTQDDFAWFLTQAFGDPAATGCTLASPCSWATIAAAYPDGGLQDSAFGFIGLKAGSGEGDTVRYADKLTIDVGGDATTYDFEPAGECQTSTSGTTITLLADCTTDHTYVVPNGYTLDGDGYLIRAVDPSGGHFLGAVVQAAAGTSAVTIRDLEVTASGLADICDGGVDRLRGILFDGVGGTVRDVNVHGVRQGLSGCQEGNAIEFRNFDGTGAPASPRVTAIIRDNLVTDYQKNGITVNGGINATVTGNVVRGDGPVTYIAQNGIQLAFGASGTVNGNTVTGNDYTPKSFVACGMLYFEATGIAASGNSYSGGPANERNSCNYGKGGGNTKPSP